MAAFLIDDFTDTDGTTLTSHTGQVGATWTLPGSEATATMLIQDAASTSGTGRYRARRSASAGTGHYLSSGTPPSADYWIKALVRVFSSPINGTFGFTLRTDSTCANCYLFQYLHATGVWQMWKKVAGTFSQTGMPADVSGTLAAGQTYEIKFGIVGSQIDVLLDGASLFSFTNGDVTAAGKVGVRVNVSDAGSATTGFHLDQITGDTGTETALHCVGASVDIGIMASPQATSRWPHLVAMANGWNDYNRAQSSTRLLDMCSDDRLSANNQVYLPIGRTANDRWLFANTIIGDMWANGDNAAVITSHKGILRAAVTWVSHLAADIYEGNNGIWTPSGTWTPLFANGVNLTYTTTNGSTLTGSVSGTAITVVYSARTDSAGCNAMEVRIDASLVDTINCNTVSASTFDNYGAGTARYVAFAKRYSGLSSGAHTVEIKHNGTGGSILAFWFASGTGGTPGAMVYLGNSYKLATWSSPGAPYNNGSDAGVAAYSAAMDEIVADFWADGYMNVRKVDTQSLFDNSADLDGTGVHPDNSGHVHLAQGFLSRRPHSVISRQAVNRAATY